MEDHIMKTIYEQPELEIIEFIEEDIMDVSITTEENELPPVPVP